MNYAVAGGVDAADFGGTLPSGTVTFAAGQTAKVITINVSGDTVVEANEQFTVTLSSASGASIGTATATGTITNDDAALPQIVGTNGCNVLTGTSKSEIFIALGGDDTVRAGGGDDIIKATIGDGKDSYDGGSGSDTVDYSALTAAVTVTLPDACVSGTVQGTQSGSDRLYSIENVIGSLAADVLRGNGGANRIDGNRGNDKLTGGADNDTFVFKSAPFGRDTITDFDDYGNDTIEFSTSVFANFAAVQAALTASGGDVFITHSADNVITLKGTTLASVTASDFLFVA